MAKNFLRLDVSAAGYTPLLNTAGMEEPNPDLHHPPLLHWTVALGFSLLGESENHARAVPALFTLLNILLISLLIMACAGTRQPDSDTPDVVEAPGYNESFDPLSLNDDDIMIEPQKTAVPVNNQTDEPTENTTDTRVREVNGFRVQILATNNIETASLSEQEATDRFEKTGHQTYLLFEAPLYKVRIGDCLNRAEAEELRELVLSYGYAGAFIVKSRVIKRQ